jgi:hypothetical protein
MLNRVDSGVREVEEGALMADRQERQTMKINPKAEILGRETVVACIARDPERVVRAMEAIEQEDPKTSGQVLEIYGGVGRAALMAVYKGGLPNEPQNRELAHEIVSSGTWTDLSETSTFEVLESLTIEHVPVVPPGEAVATLFITIGYLLAIYCEPLGYATTYELLDALLTEIEKA